MSESKNKDFFEQIKQRAERSLKVREANFNSELYYEEIRYTLF